MCVCLNLFEVSRRVVFTLHHVKEYGDGRSPQLFLRDERHLQDGTHHPGNETDLILAELVPHVSDSKTNQTSHVSISE